MPTQKAKKTVPSSKRARSGASPRRGRPASSDTPKTQRTTKRDASSPRAPTANAKPKTTAEPMVFEEGLDRQILEGMLNNKEQFLKDMATQGVTREVILQRAADLGLSEGYLRHVQNVVTDLAGDGSAPSRPIPTGMKPRNCLSCSRVFLSSGSGNRLCMRCRGADAGLGAL